MKRYYPFLIAAIAVIVLASLIIGREEKKPEAITVYSYDSFISEWGPGPIIAELFTETTGIEVELIAPGDAGQMLSRLISEKDQPLADVVIGIDNNLYPKAKEAGVLHPYRSPFLTDTDPELLFDGDLLSPYDYGYFAFIWDSTSPVKAPESFSDLTDERFRNKIIIMDPRTSTPGLGLLLWSAELYGEEMDAFWRDLAPNILTVTSGWDSGYGLFTSGEAPMVLSYTTSPAYHLEYEESTRYQALIFPEGHYLQVEGAGIVSGSDKVKEAQQFIDFLLSRDAQEIIPLTNWMYPVQDEAALPDSYRVAPKPGKSLIRATEPGNEELDNLISRWSAALLQ
jgi:thiamine transport system substrate-binding protein